MSYDENQLQLPPSFHALHLDAQQRPTAPLAEVQARYELCEDLAQHLVAQTAGLQHDTLRDKQDVLRRCRAALGGPEAGLAPGEADWVVWRLAELLDWPAEAARGPGG